MIAFTYLLWVVLQFSSSTSMELRRQNMHLLLWVDYVILVFTGLLVFYSWEMVYLMVNYSLHNSYVLIYKLLIWRDYKLKFLIFLFLGWQYPGWFRYRATRIYCSFSKNRWSKVSGEGKATTMRIDVVAGLLLLSRLFSYLDHSRQST